jgi:hypothetical protein
MRVILVVLRGRKSLRQVGVQLGKMKDAKET